MGKYAQYERNKKTKPTHKIHPIWTGIGFLLIIIVPVITWAAANVLVDFGKTQKWSILRNMPKYLQLPDFLTSTPALYQLTRIDSLPAVLIFFAILLLIFSALFSVAYAAIYRVIGPPRYAADDIPAPRIKTKKFTR